MGRARGAWSDLGWKEKERGREGKREREREGGCKGGRREGEEFMV